MIFFPITWKERILRSEKERAADGVTLQREREEGKAPLAGDKGISAISIQESHHSIQIIPILRRHYIIVYTDI